MAMKCLILASGRGTRLSEISSSKPLTPVLGTRLIERVIVTALMSGLKEFYVVSGYNGNKVRHFLDRLARELKVSIKHLVNEEWEKESGTAVLKASNVLAENFVLLMADHLFDGVILEILLQETLRSCALVLAVDRRIKGNKFVDMADVTKVLVQNQKIVDIGKNIDRYNAFDTGIFLCSPDFFQAIGQCGDRSIPGGIMQLAAEGRARTVDVGDRFWLDVDDPQALAKAEKHLSERPARPGQG